MSKPQRTLAKGVAEFTVIATVCADRLVVKSRMLGPAMTVAGVDPNSREAAELMAEETKRINETISEEGQARWCAGMARRHAGNGFVDLKQP